MPYIYKSGLQFGINEINIYGGASYVELTQAEYDALSDAEKHNGQIYFITDGNYDFLIVNDSVPVGSIQAYGGMTVPTNWLICDGSAVSRTDYKELFQVIGISFGEGDGVTTFNIPDLRGRVLTGAGSLNSINYELGQQKSAGLPNITGSKKLGWSDSSGGGTIMQSDSNMGAFGIASSTTAHFAKGTGSGTYNNILTFNASNSNSIYGNSTTVQPNTTVANYIIKAKNPSITSGQQLQAMELFYPVGAYFETSDINFNPNETWGGTWECIPTKNIIKSSGEKTIATAETYTLCSATLEPNTKYIIFGNVATNNGSSFTIICNLSVSGTVVYQLGDAARTTTNAGQGVVTWRYVETGDSSVTVDCLSYGYYTTSHIERGKILAIPLNQSGNYKWHRTA